MRPLNALPHPATCATTSDASCHARMSAIEAVGRLQRPSGCFSSTPTLTSCSGSGYGSGRSIAASITEKIAVETPIPSASVAIATNEEPR
jgi:hypothetical protein